MRQEIYIGIQNYLAKIIKGTEWEGHVFMVGGCIRDSIMNRELHDIDLAIDLVNGGVKFVRWLAKRHFAMRDGIEFFINFGTAKVKLNKFPEEVIDCVQTRKDKYVFQRHPKPEKNFGTILEDAIRRDLTINSLFYNISTGELLDPTGYGIHDIENHIIRTPNTPDITLTDNPMHVLRCIRFAVKYGWELSAETIEDLKRNVKILEEATPRRMMKEVISILDLPDKDKALNLIEEIGAKHYVDPVIEAVRIMNEQGLTIDEAKPKLRHKREHQNRERQNREHRGKAKAASADSRPSDKNNKNDNDNPDKQKRRRRWFHHKKKNNGKGRPEPKIDLDDNQ